MAITVTVTIDSDNEILLLDKIPNIQTWVDQAVDGKVNNCWKDFRSTWTAKLIDDDSFDSDIPSNKSGLISLVTSRSDYKNRAQRDSDDANAM